MSQPQGQYHPPQLYISAIIAVGIIALVVGTVVGYGLGSASRPFGASILQPAQLTYTHGTISVPSGNAFTIVFDNQNSGSLSSSVYSNGNFYQVYLPSNVAYQVTVRYFNGLSVQTCQARPQPFTPTGSTYNQDFFC